MIDNYKDHAANERTFLAWVRTGVTIAVFGFVLEKFELFLSSLSGSNFRVEALPQTTSEYIGVVSIVLILFGIGIILLSAWHFMSTRQAILSKNTKNYSAMVPVFAVSSMVVVSGLFLLAVIVRLF